MTERPVPGSPWDRYCRDAWPREWLDASGELPSGFVRAAEPIEADLICGRIDEAVFARQSGRAAPPSRPPGRLKKRRPPVVEKIFAANLFGRGLVKLEPRLSSLAVAVWFWLWICEQKGLARCSVAKLADRFGVSRSTVQRRLAELRARGFIRLVRRGKSGRSPSVYRVRPSPKPSGSNRPKGGPEPARG